MWKLPSKLRSHRGHVSSPYCFQFCGSQRRETPPRQNRHERRTTFRFLLERERAGHHPSPLVPRIAKPSAERLSASIQQAQFPPEVTLTRDI